MYLKLSLVNVWFLNSENVFKKIEFMFSITYRDKYTIPRDFLLECSFRAVILVDMQFLELFIFRTALMRYTHNTIMQVVGFKEKK